MTEACEIEHGNAVRSTRTRPLLSSTCRLRAASQPQRRIMAEPSRRSGRTEARFTKARI